VSDAHSLIQNQANIHIEIQIVIVIVIAIVIAIFPKFSTGANTRSEIHTNAHSNN